MELPLGTTLLLPYDFAIQGFLRCDGSTFRAPDYELLAGLMGGISDQMTVTLPKPAVPLAGLTWAMAAHPYVMAPLGAILLFPKASVFTYQKGYVPCDGRPLSSAQYRALYALMGTKFGGDGTTTFQLPDLRAAAPADQLQYLLSLDGPFPARV